MTSQTELKFLDNPTLETERLILRKLKISDAEDVFHYAMEPEVAKYVPWDAHKLLEDSKNFISCVLERYDRDETGDWGIELRDFGRIVGTIGFPRVDWLNRYGEIGYALAKELWGKGIMTEAVLRLLKFGFEQMKLNRIEAVHAVENEASGRVMKKAGMQYEGLLQQRLFVNGQFLDVRQYAILNEDWVKTGSLQENG